MWISNTRRRFYYLHIPKTAGSSLGSVLLQPYAPSTVLNCELGELLQRGRPEINEHLAFAGHWGTGLFSLLDRPIACLTVLRDPFERMISAIRFAQREGHPSEHPEIQAILGRGDLHEIFYHPVVSGAMENTQSLYLGRILDLNGYLEVPPPGIAKSTETIPYLEYKWAIEFQTGVINMDAVVTEAKRQLDRMEVVGLFEQLQETTNLACDFLGIRPPKSLPQQRMSPERMAQGNTTYRGSGTIPPDIVRRIDDLTARDCEVYDYARRIFARQLASRRRRYFWPFGIR